MPASKNVHLARNSIWRGIPSGEKFHLARNFVWRVGLKAALQTECSGHIDYDFVGDLFMARGWDFSPQSLFQRTAFVESCFQSTSPVRFFRES